MDIEHQHFFFNSNYHNYNARGMLQRTRIDPTCNSSVAHSRKTIKFVYFSPSPFLPLLSSSSQLFCMAYFFLNSFVFLTLLLRYALVTVQTSVQCKG